MKLFTTLAAASLSATYAANVDCKVNAAGKACDGGANCYFWAAQTAKAKGDDTYTCAVDRTTTCVDNAAVANPLVTVGAACTGSKATAKACTDLSVTTGDAKFTCGNTKVDGTPAVVKSAAKCSFICSNLKAKDTCGGQTGCEWKDAVPEVKATGTCAKQDGATTTLCAAVTPALASPLTCGAAGGAGGLVCCKYVPGVVGKAATTAQCVNKAPAAKGDDSSATAAVTSAFVATAAALLM